MLTARQLFQQYLAKTSDFPLELEPVKAEGIHLFDKSGKKYIDLISGISVSNLGHRHPEVIHAIKKQLDKYTYLMVYGEYVLSPQVKLAELITRHTSPDLDNVYFVNSGTEAVEGAIKLAKRYTGRPHVISFKNAYHGSTQGSLSLMGNETYKQAFRPLVPGIRHIHLNSIQELDKINDKTACVILEPVQGEAGIRIPGKEYMSVLRKKCTENGALLVFDEIQTGYGRTGTLFNYQQYEFTPDIISLAKGMGGGMPLGAFISSKKIMSSLKNNPILGHITTFGGHPVSCAASLKTLEVILRDKIIDDVPGKEKIFRENLIHPAIKEIRSKGLFMAIELDSFETVKKVIIRCLEKGLITDWFLFCNNALRVAPPLTITPDEIRLACEIIVESVEEVWKGDR